MQLWMELISKEKEKNWPTPQYEAGKGGDNLCLQMKKISYNGSDSNQGSHITMATEIQQAKH